MCILPTLSWGTVYTLSQKASTSAPKSLRHLVGMQTFCCRCCMLHIWCNFGNFADGDDRRKATEATGILVQVQSFNLNIWQHYYYFGMCCLLPKVNCKVVTLCLSSTVCSYMFTQFNWVVQLRMYMHYNIKHTGYCIKMNIPPWVRSPVSPQ